MSDDDDDSSFQLEKLISSEDTSPPDKTGPNPQCQVPNSSVSESDKLVCSINVNDETTASKQTPDLNQCYSWLQQNVGRRHRKDSEFSASTDSGSSTSSSSSSSSSFVSLPMPEPPDGGWGWMVVLGAFMVSFICDGLAYCFGVLYAELLIQFGESRSKTSMVGSIFFGVSMILGPFASSMTRRFGCRKMTIFGGLLSSTGFMLSYFTNSIEMLCITFSLIVGIGFSFCYITSVVIVAFYFKRRRALATGLAVCGTGMGTLTFAPFMEYLISEYGWRGLFLIMSGLSLNLVVCGMLFRPLKLSETERCTLLLEEFDKIPHGRREMELKLSRDTSESTDDSSDSDCSEDDMRFLSTTSLPTFARGKVRDASCDLLLEALKNSRNPHLTIQRYMKNALLRLNGHDINDKDNDQDATQSTSAKTFTISINKSSEASLHPSVMVHNIADCCTNDKIFIPAASRPSTSKSPRMKRSEVVLTGTKVVVKKIAEPNDRHVAAEKSEKINSQTSQSSRLNVGRRWAYGIHLPLYRSDIFYRRWLKQNQNAQLKPCMLGTSCPELSESLESKSEGNFCQRTASRYFHNVIDFITDMVDCSLFTNGFFALFVVSNFLYYFWSDVPYMYAADHAIAHGASARKASFVISVVGIFNTFGQVCFGILGDMKVNLISLYAIVSVFAGVFVAIVPVVSAVYWQSCIFYGLFGFCISVGYPLTTVLMVNYLGVEKLTSAYGLLMLMQGIANLFGPPFAGWVSDRTGTYNSSFYLSGVFYALSGLVMFFIYIPACKTAQVIDRTSRIQSVDRNTTTAETSDCRNIHDYP